MTGPIDLTSSETSVLRKRRAVLLRQLPSLRSILRGSVIERYKRCGKSGCSCMQGQGHGPKYYLSVSHSGMRPEMVYVPSEFQEQVTSLVDNYRRARAMLDEICEINLELLRRREELE